MPRKTRTKAPKESLSVSEKPSPLSAKPQLKALARSLPVRRSTDRVPVRVTKTAPSKHKETAARLQREAQKMEASLEEKKLKQTQKKIETSEESPVRVTEKPKRAVTSPEKPRPAPKHLFLPRQSQVRTDDILKSAAKAGGSVLLVAGILGVGAGAAMALSPAASLLSIKSLLEVPWLQGPLASVLQWKIGPLATNVLVSTKPAVLAKVAANPLIARPIMAGGQSLALFSAALSAVGALVSYAGFHRKH